MIPQNAISKKLSSSQISVAAEAFAAAQFALAGFDVLERAGQARFFFNLAVARAGGMLRVTVHASISHFWDLVDRHLDHSKRASLTAADYHRAIDRWLDNQNPRVTCCLVQFELAEMNRMPRIYLASAAEVAAQLHTRVEQLATGELGNLSLDVVHRPDALPVSWRFSQARIAQLMEQPAEEISLAVKFADAVACQACVSTQPAACVECMSMVN